MNRTNRPSLDLLKDKKDLIGAEIGVQAGLNAEWMLENLDIKKLYLIDPYKAYPSNNKEQTLIGPFTKGKKNAKKLLKKYEDKIEWVYKYSWDTLGEFLDGQFDFVYIDADHREEVVLQDLQYIKKVKLGGLLCGHDWRFPSVKTAISKFFLYNRIKFECCETAQYVPVFEKHTADSDWWIRVPTKKDAWYQKCKMCQKEFKFNLKDINCL